MSCIVTHAVYLRGRCGAGEICLRPASDADIPLLCELNRDPRALIWSSESEEPYTEEMVRQVWGYVSPMALCFIIEVEGVPVGDCWLQRMNLPQVIARYPEGTDVRRIDMSIGRVEYWGRGVGTAMVELLMEHAFTVDGADVLHCMCDSRNTRSDRIWQRLGFELVWKDAPGCYENHYALRREAYLRRKKEQ